MSDVDFVRPIGAVENLFSAYCEVGAMTFAMVAELGDDIDESRLASSLAAVQAMHPMLRVRLGTDEHGRLGFFNCDGPVTSRVKSGSMFDLEAAVADAIGEPFASGEGPLMRVIALRDGTMTSLICVWHHAIADGRNALTVLREIVLALRGKGPTQPAGLDPIDRYIDYRTPPIHRGTVMPTEIDRDVSVTIDHLSPAVSARLLRVAKTHGVTFNSLIVAAVAAVHDHVSGGPTPKIMSPVDLRPVLDVERQDGLFISIAVTARQEDEDLWDHANRIGEGIAAARRPKAIAGFVTAIGDRFGSAEDYVAVRSQLLSNPPFDTIVTNLGVVSGGAETDPSETVRIFGPILKPLNGQDIIAVSTFSGSISLMHSSVRGDRTLLRRIRTLLQTID